MISKQAVLALLDKYKLNTKTGPILLREDINRLPSIGEDGFKRDIIFKLSLALSDYFNDDQLSLIKQCLNKLIPVPIRDRWISVEDRLPDIGEEYNVALDLDDGMGDLVSSTMEFDSINKEWSYPSTNVICNGVTHWQPIPPAPTK